MIHTTIGVYPSGKKKVNGVTSENLAEHIKYNILFRPGRALFLDGCCINLGLFMKIKEMVDLEVEFESVKATEDTQPYV